MRILNLLLGFSATLNLSAGHRFDHDKHYAARQDSTSPTAFPTLSAFASSQSSETSALSTRDSSIKPTSATPATSVGISTSTGISGNSTLSVTATATTVSSASDAAASTIDPTANSTSTNGTSVASGKTERLPLQPHITPALSVGGVFLILTGVVYALIGVKNRWVHVSLSAAYLASLAVLVLIVYVTNPPVSNAVQGAYLVGIFMSGLIFGGGALIFKDITEGLGCLLGGFCLSMWFLVLKPGGLMTSTGGKAIFIATSCLVVWSLSFSHYTRAYGLIGSTSLSGSTAFVLGIDCFSKGGLKEFWIYIWGLNNNLFPLNTTTYPITKGVRVEIIVIVLGTIIGVVSQVRLWKVVRDRHAQRAAIQVEDDRRRDAVEEALGRHLERQNDRDRSEWEKRYGDRLGSKRNTVLWSETQGEHKRFSGASITEVGSSENSESKESLEMGQMQPVYKTPLHSSRSKRQSTMSVQPIQEVAEEENFHEEHTHQKHVSMLTESRNGALLPQILDEKLASEVDSQSSPKIRGTELNEKVPNENLSPSDAANLLKPSKSKPSSKSTADRLQLSEGSVKTKKRSSLRSLEDLKRLSAHSMTSKGSHFGEKSSGHSEFSQSKEALVKPDTSDATHSRASSVAATMDNENETPDMPTLDEEYNLSRGGRPPQIMISLANSHGFNDQFRLSFAEPPSPSGLSESFDADPEALVRPATNKAHGFESSLTGTSANRDASNGIQLPGHTISQGDLNQASGSEGLTKGALDLVPSQMSNVVLSYRTNEWAKHIATAEAPVYEESDPAAQHDEEAPSHLADPKSLAIGHASIETGAKPPTLPSPVTSVAPSEAGIKLNPDMMPIDSARSRPASVTSDANWPNFASRAPEPVNYSASPSSTETPLITSNVLFQTPSQVSAINTNQRSHTEPAQQPIHINQPKVSRRVSNPMARQPSVVQKSTIDGNMAKKSAQRAPIRTSTNASFQSQHNMSQPNLARNPYIDPSYSASSNDGVLQRPSAVHRSSSTTSMSDQNAPGMRSETRLSDYAGSSHQPLQRNNTSEHRREHLMTDWRMQLARSHRENVVPLGTADGRYSQQMYDYEADKKRKEQMKSQRAKQEAVMDQSMRTQSMIDAHREVLRKMQSKANEKLAQ